MFQSFARFKIHCISLIAASLLAGCLDLEDDSDNAESSDDTETQNSNTTDPNPNSDPRTANPDPSNSNPGNTDPTTNEPGQSSNVVGGAYEVPPEYPEVNSRFATHAVWAVDQSGFELIPNRSHASVDELEVSEGTASFGALYDEIYNSLLISFTDRPNDQIIELLLPSFAPGLYDLTSFDVELRYTERGGYLYTTQIEGGRGQVEIVANDGQVLWGTFSGRVCYISTPGVNCKSIYEGRFSAVVQGGAPVNGEGTPTPPGPAPEPGDDDSDDGGGGGPVPPAPPAPTAPIGSGPAPAPAGES